MTLRELLEQYNDKFICIDYVGGRFKGTADEVKSRFELSLNDEAFVDDTGADDYDVYIGL